MVETEEGTPNVPSSSLKGSFLRNLKALFAPSHSKDFVGDRYFVPGLWEARHFGVCSPRHYQLHGRSAREKKRAYLQCCSHWISDVFALRSESTSMSQSPQAVISSPVPTPGLHWTKTSSSIMAHSDVTSISGGNNSNGCASSEYCNGNLQPA